MASAAAREQFAAAVAALPRGRVLPEAFRPRKVVYAILLENGRGTPKDLERAEALYAQVCTSGSAIACEAATRLSGTPADHRPAGPR